MGKIITLLSNVKKIFKYVNIIAYISGGLKVAASALSAAIAEIKESKPDFKYLPAMESLLDFVNTIKDVLDKFMDVFGIKAAEVSAEGERGFSGELSDVNSKIKGMLDE